MAHRQNVNFGDESRFQLYPVDGRLRVHRLPGERSQQRCQSYRVQAGGGSVHVWGAFHSGAKWPLVLPNRYLTGELYRSILRNNLMPFARQHFGVNYCYKDDYATPHRARVILDFLQQRHQEGAACKIARLQTRILYIWDELGSAITSMDNPPQNLGELPQVLLDEWAEIIVERLQRLVASMPRPIAAIIAARGVENPILTQYTQHHTSSSIMQKIKLVWPDLLQS